MKKIAILIPCFNESLTIQKVIADWKRALPEAHIYVYDNNSTDDTAKLAQAAGAEVRYEYHQGKGNVIRRMFREIDAECYIMVDGDDTYPVEYGAEMVNKVLLHHADMVVGDRLSSTYYQENKRPFHNFGNDLVRNAINYLFQSDIKDIMTGYRAFSYSFVKTFPVMSHGFEIETEMTIHAVEKNMQVENVVVNYRDRPQGSVSKLNTIPDGIRVLRMILRLFRDYKPLCFFGLVALFLSVLALALDIPILMTFADIHQVPRFPTLIVSGFIFMAALLSLFAGLILHTLIGRDKQEFEFRLQQVQQWYKQYKKDE